MDKARLTQRLYRSMFHINKEKHGCEHSRVSFFYCAFRQVEHEVRNKQPPAVRVGNKGYTKNSPNMVE